MSVVHTAKRIVIPLRITTQATLTTLGMLSGIKWLFKQLPQSSSQINPVTDVVFKSADTDRVGGGDL